MPPTQTVTDRYLNLLIECVNGSVYGPPSQLVAVHPRSKIKRRVANMLEKHGHPLAVRETVECTALDEGVGWPIQRWNPGESMVGRARLRQFKDAVSTVLRDGIPGDVIETGVWRGGSCIVAKAVLDAFGDTTRRVFVADSFAGLPSTDSSDDAAELHDDVTLAVSEGEVRSAFERYGLLDDRVVFVKGWFCDTLRHLDSETWSVVRLDGDMYESTMDGLTHLYPQLSPGGYLIVDDYHAYESCRRAVTEYRALHGIEAAITDIDATGTFWRK